MKATYIGIDLVVWKNMSILFQEKSQAVKSWKTVKLKTSCDIAAIRQMNIKKEVHFIPRYMCVCVHACVCVCAK